MEAPSTLLTLGRCAGDAALDQSGDKDGDSDVTCSSSPTPPPPVKRQTRQWAAWTKQEEESFFNALRQVGKNFEMITCRVKSKNKDQVRFYYYRLVRRMNKILGPEFSLDAKNSKETNAAMLRWWSLLEKYSCKASKLHLKPRRFKIFVEALEHQLLKDRKKSTRRRAPQNENNSTLSPANLSIQSKASGHDTRSVKLGVIESQNIQKVASGKGSLPKRGANNGTKRSNSKGDLSTVKTTRQRRKTGGTSSAAYKRWEKAAIAGVSLVADAAEHLERITINKEVLPDKSIPDEPFPSTSVPTETADVLLGKKVTGSVENGVLHPSLPTSSEHQTGEASIQPSVKLKLQLFPIDEATRLALEKEEHNPYLELTLTARKRITSVLEHLIRKWGRSSIASGNLILFPYSAQRDNIIGYRRWTMETVVTAADVYASLGSPQVFRLRYGWFDGAELVALTSGSASVPLYPRDENMSLNSKEQNTDPPVLPNTDRNTSLNSRHPVECFSDQPTFVLENTEPSVNISEDMTGHGGASPDNNVLTGHVANSEWHREQIGEGTIRRRWDNMENARASSSPSLSPGDWADSLTNISVGELLTEASHMETDDGEPAVESANVFQQIPFSCDSFDAAIAAHIAAGPQQKFDLPSVQVSHAPSIWDAEETCDAFSFRKNLPPKQNNSLCSTSTASVEMCKETPLTPMCLTGLFEEPPKTRISKMFVNEEASVDKCGSDANSSKDLGGLTDLYWPESLGPILFDTPTSKYQTQDLIFGDSVSLSGLNRLIANSLDAFQNCAFFGLEKASPGSEGHETAPLLDCKIGDV